MLNEQWLTLSIIWCSDTVEFHVMMISNQIRGKISHLIHFFIVNTDIDECATSETNDCGPNAVCNNTDGSYVCLCASGYKGDGRNCTGKYFSLKKYSLTI